MERKINNFSLKGFLHIFFSFYKNTCFFNFLFIIRHLSYIYFFYICTNVNVAEKSISCISKH